MTDLPDVTCPACGAAASAADAFCEACGSPLPGTEVLPPPTAAPVATVPPQTPPLPPAPPAPRLGSCRECGGDVLADGFCGVCGQRGRSPRDHWAETPVPWVAGVCDKGIAHARNEDAMALAGVADGSFAALVVCDGVTTAPDSDRASLAASRAACSLLSATPSATGSGVAAVVSHWGRALHAACAEANVEVVAVARVLGDPVEPPSCTFVAAVVAGQVLTVAWCGDSRAYWVPDEGEPLLLTTDHSLGTEMVRDGMERAQAELDPAFHTITRWLGADSHDPTPELASLVLDADGWVLVCSDGLWNYASAPAEMAAQVRQAAVGGTRAVVEVADALVAWANELGGHDNITAALARVNSVRWPAKET